MSVSLEFYAGDADSIGADFTASAFDGLREGTRARAWADFSIHLSPSDLDILSEVIAERVGTEPLLLNDCLVRTVGGDGDERSAEVVSPDWVRMVAAVGGTPAREIAATWIEQVGEEHGEEYELSPEAVRAVEELVRLCQLAEQEDLAVVHTWHL